MNPSVLKGSALSAALALATVGMGLRPAHADWVLRPLSRVDADIQLPSLSLVMSKANSTTTIYVGGVATNNPQLDGQGHAEAIFDWQPGATATPEDHLYIGHKMSLSGPLATSLDGGGGNNSATATIILNGTQNWDKTSYNYYTNQANHMSSVYLNENTRDVRYYFYVGPNGVEERTVSPKWDPKLTSSVVASTSYHGGNNGQVVYDGGGTASVGASRAQTVDIFVNP